VCLPLYCAGNVTPITRVVRRDMSVVGKNMAGDNIIASTMHSSTESMQPLHMACRGRAGKYVCKFDQF
jgi:hypothetical protein